MATGQMNGLIQHLRRAAFLQDGAELPDGQLLERFLARREEAAFEALVRRHGPMVLGVCRRVLKNEHDAEDAFQAAFLVLVRKAASLRPREAVGNWLYGVAYHTALKARAATMRRRVKEAQVRPMPRQDALNDWQPLLDQELSRLPDKYREAVVLCDLQGKSRRDAAVQLGIPEGTFSGRLTTARRLLAKRLARRGVTLSGGALAAVLAPQAASACVPMPLVCSTVKAAALLAAGQTAAGVISIKVAALTEGVLKAMLMTKLKVTAAIALVVGLIAVTSGMLAHGALAGAPTDPSATVANERETPASTLTALQRPKKDDPKAGPTLAGKLEAVDADKNSITVSIRDRKDGASEKTFSVAKDAKIQRDGKDAKLADLQKGSRATLTLSADQKSVVAIATGTPPMSAPLKSVDAGKNTITVTIRGRPESKDMTYQVAKDAKILIDGKEAKLADLKAGTILTLTLVDANTVSEVRTTATRRDRKQDE